jgi:S1-C subfamily serine protease
MVAGVIAAAGRGETPADARRIERAFQAVIARAEPSVACVLVYRDRGPVADDSARKPPEQSDLARVPDYYGSGVVIDPAGLILTNYHVVRDANRIYVRLPGRKDKDGTEGPPRTALATVYAADNRSDLAVLKMPAAAKPFAALELGRGEDLRKGSLVLALGHPYAAGFRDGSPSASSGIVSNLRRRPPGSPNELERTSKTLQQYGTLVQTDARLQLGCSGGALLDLDGRLVGLTTAQAALTGVDMPGGFAQPLDVNLRRIIEVLKEGKEVEYGFLGVSADPEHNQPREGGGVMLNTIVPNSPAAKAGLNRGDVILKVGGQPVREHDDLFLHLGAALAGRQTELLVVQPWNGREPRAVSVVLAKSPVSGAARLESVTVQPDGRPVFAKYPVTDFGKATNRPVPVHGLRVDYTSVIARQQLGEPIPEGVVVREVMPGSPAKAKGLQDYVDVITEVNGKPVKTPAEFYNEARRAAEAGEAVRLTLRNPPRTVTLP